MTPPDDDALHVLRQASFGQVLFRAARLFNEEAIARVQEHEPRFRFAHTQLLPHLDAVGVRPVDLARKLGISKQAVGELLGDLLDVGVIEQVADPADARVRRVRTTARGREAMVHGLGVLGALADEVEAELGAEATSRLKVDLDRLMAVLEARAMRGGGGAS